MALWVVTGQGRLFLSTRHEHVETRFLIVIVREDGKHSVRSFARRGGGQFDGRLTDESLK